MKNQFKVINLGLNELGVKEFNNFYKENIERGYIREVIVGERYSTKSKVFKQEKSFLEKGIENEFGSFGIKACSEGQPYFIFKLKHINYKIVKLVLLESEFNF
jgi:hypothetical protein